MGQDGKGGKVGKVGKVIRKREAPRVWPEGLAIATFPPFPFFPPFP